MCSANISSQNSKKRIISLQASNSLHRSALWLRVNCKLWFYFHPLFFFYSDDEEQIVTPFAQILATLKDVRSNLSILVARGSGPCIGSQDRQMQNSFLHPNRYNTPSKCWYFKILSQLSYFICYKESANPWLRLMEDKGLQLSRHLRDQRIFCWTTKVNVQWVYKTNKFT